MNQKVHYKKEMVKNLARFLPLALSGSVLLSLPLSGAPWPCAAAPVTTGRTQISNQTKCRNLTRSKFGSNISIISIDDVIL